MIEHHTKNKGDLGVLKVKCDLCSKGYTTLTPDTEHAPFDLVVWKDSKFLSVQVKYRKMDSLGRLHIQFKSNWADRNGNHSNYVNKDFIDVYGVYCPDTDKCYYFNPDDFNKSASLRMIPSKNNQKNGVHLVEDYLDFPDI